MILLYTVVIEGVDAEPLWRGRDMVWFEWMSLGRIKPPCSVEEALLVDQFWTILEYLGEFLKYKKSGECHEFI